MSFFITTSVKSFPFRLENVENCLVDQSQLGSQNQLLEGDVKTLQKNLDDYQKKYAEAIVTLKEVQDTVRSFSFSWFFSQDTLFFIDFVADFILKHDEHFLRPSLSLFPKDFHTAIFVLLKKILAGPDKLK